MGHHTVSPSNRLKVTKEARWQNRRRFVSLTRLTLHRVDSLLRFLPCDTGTVDLFPRRLASVLETGLAVMQGVSASAADRRLQVESDVRVQQKAVEQLYERHAKVALSLARWNSRVDRAMEQRNADLVIE